VDPGTRATGWGIVRGGPGPRALGAGVIIPPGRWPLEQRLRAIFDELRKIIERFTPAAVAIEDPFVGTNARSAMAVGEARTVAMLAANLAGVPVHHYPPATVKQTVAGNGRSDKEQVREMLRLQLGGRAPDDLNASDALAVALCHALHRGAGALLESGPGPRRGPARR
jgi:crossover junction endodeoxyribonuclease RuvC